VSGARPSPALDAGGRCPPPPLRRVVCWRLDRLGRSLKHLVLVLDDCRRSASPSSVWPKASTAQHRLASFRCTSAAIAEFERGRIVERVRAASSVLGPTVNGWTASRDNQRRRPRAHVSTQRRKAAAFSLPTLSSTRRKRSEIPPSRPLRPAGNGAFRPVALLLPLGQLLNVSLIAAMSLIWQQFDNFKRAR